MADELISYLQEPEHFLPPRFEIGGGEGCRSRARRGRGRLELRDLVRGAGVRRAQSRLDLLEPRHTGARVTATGKSGQPPGRALALALESGRALLQGGPVERREGRGGGQPPLEGGDACLDARTLAGERLRIALRANLVQVEQHPGVAVADGRARDLAAARFELFGPEHGGGADPA